jgi:hypothetical protein
MEYENNMVRHIMEVSHTVNKLDANFLYLVEVESLQALEVLNKVLEVEYGDATYVPYFVKSTDYFTGQGVGILIRVDPSSRMWRSNEEEQLLA